MKTITHSLQFVTEVDETNPTVMRLLEMPLPMQVEFLEGMLKAVVAPKIQPILDEINAGGTWAVLKVVA